MMRANQRVGEVCECVCVCVLYIGNGVLVSLA